nr:hypothetical protein [Streptomyces lucensis]
MARGDGASEVGRWDRHGRKHVVRVRRSGVRRTMSCDTCGWRQGARLRPLPKAERHLAEAHQATVDPAGARQGPSTGR